MAGGKVVCRSRLGGVLNFCQREAARSVATDVWTLFRQYEIPTRDLDLTVRLKSASLLGEIAEIWGFELDNSSQGESYD